jgi:glyoxylate/succinic semialdehyde reductase
MVNHGWAFVQGGFSSHNSYTYSNCSMMASFSEGLTLGKKVGLDPATIVQVVGQGAIAAPMFALKGPSMIKGSYPPAFALKHQQKDIRLALAMAEDIALPTPVAASVNELYKRAKAAGLGDQDYSAIIEAFELDPKRSNH